MPTYEELISDKKYVPNVVIRIMGEYFAIRQPDSGLIISDIQKSCMASFTLSGTSFDRLNPATSVSQNSFRLVDRNGHITSFFGFNPQMWQGEKVEAWLGRSGVGMSFADYLELPETSISKLSRQDGSYTFSTKESKDRLNTAYFSQKTKLGATILDNTTSITIQTAPPFNSGYAKVGEEFFSFTGYSGGNLTGCIRGELGSTPQGATLGSDVFFVTVVEDNPINCLLKLLISSGGGGIYDTLGGGGGIDETLIDVDEFEEIRDEHFVGQNYRCIIYDEESLKKYIEEEILMPAGVRLRTNFNGKIGLGVLNHPVLNLDAPDISNINTVKQPVYSVDENKVANKIIINYGYNNGTEEFTKTKEFTDAASITQFGLRKTVEYSFKNLYYITLDSEVDDLVDEIGQNLLEFFAWPKPTVELNAHMEVSRWSITERPFVTSDYLPTEDGTLNFADSLEIVSQSVNVQTGDVRVKLQFNQFTGLRVCFIAPSDSVVSTTDDRTITIGAGRGGEYRKGWKMILWNKTLNQEVALSENEIESISGDTIIFKYNFPLTPTTNHRIKFVDYNQATETQKRFCYVGCGTTFDDNAQLYKLYCS